VAPGKIAVSGLDNAGKITDVGRMIDTDQLLEVARAYSAAENIDLSTVSWRALGDTKKLAALDRGKDIQVGRFRKTMQWFSDHWPANAIWPETIERPAMQPQEQADA
jgi:hypothetical protein